MEEGQLQPGRPEDHDGSVPFPCLHSVSSVSELKALALASQTSPYKSSELLGSWCLSLSQSEAASLCGFPVLRACGALCNLGGRPLRVGKQAEVYSSLLFHGSKGLPACLMRILENCFVITAVLAPE